MQYFTRLTQLLIAGLGLLLALPALAVGTDAGLLVTNAVTLDYQVNGAVQSQQSDSVTFVVDRKLEVLVTAQDSDWVSAPINQEFTDTPPLSGVPALNFLVSNLSNADVHVVFGVIEQGAVPISGSFTNDPGATSTGVDGVLVAIDTNVNNVYDEGVDTVLTATGGIYSLPAVLSRDLASNEVEILVVADISASAVNGDYEAFSLVAGVASDLGVPYQRDDSGNVAPGIDPLTANNEVDDLADEQLVFADFFAVVDPENIGYDFVNDTSTGSADAVYDGQSSDTSGYAITGVDVLVAKYAEVIYDPISGNKYVADVLTAEPKAIPGAVIMYVIGVTNRDVAFDVEGVSIIDDIPDGTGAFELVDEGNQTGSAVNYPSVVTVDFDPGNPTPITEDFSLPAGLDQSQISTSSCDVSPVVNTTPFLADIGPDTVSGPEVDVSLGICGAGSSGFVVYFVTVETNG